MMQHLHRLHHLAGWLEAQGEAAGPLPWPQALLVGPAEQCKHRPQAVERLRDGGRQPAGELRSLRDPKLWALARKARLRLSREQVDRIFTEASEVKEESVKLEEGPADLLRPCKDPDVRVEAIVEQEPIVKFKHKVTDRVKRVLLNFYAKNEDDVVDKLGNPKEIKIKSKAEFEVHCKALSLKYQEEITDSYMSFNGSLDGIEKENIGTYNIDHEIRKIFSSLPIVNK
jgi:hypothetical protein